MKYLLLFALLIGCAQKKEPYINPLIWNLLEQKPRQAKQEPPKEEPSDTYRETESSI